MNTLRCSSCGQETALVCEMLINARVLALLHGIADQSINPGLACDEARAILDPGYRPVRGKATGA